MCLALSDHRFSLFVNSDAYQGPIPATCERRKIGREPRTAHLPGTGHDPKCDSNDIARDACGIVSDRIDQAASWQPLGLARLSTGQTAPGLEALRLSISMYRELEKVRPDDLALRNRSAEAARALAENAAIADSAD